MPLIVFTSNIFAILGLRALYFMLAGAIEKFYLLRYGLGTVLVFVGLKMVWLNQLFDGKFPIAVSLGIIAAVITLSVVLSLLFPRKEAERATAAPVEKIAKLKQRVPALKGRGQRLPKSTERFLWRTLGFYLLMLGLALILAAALSD